MTASAENAAQSLHAYYNIPYDRIELTPMLGQNDASDEITSVTDMSQIASWAKTNGLAGIHYWSFDRDTPCPGVSKGLLSASPTCNGVSGTTPLEFDNAVLTGLGID